MSKYKLWYRMRCGDSAPRYTEYLIKEVCSGNVVATYTTKQEALDALDHFNREEQTDA